MSLDTTDVTAPVPLLPPRGSASGQDSSFDHSQWKSLREKVIQRAARSSAQAVFGPSADGGAVYRWGLASALGRPCDDLLDMLARMACGAALKKKQKKAIDLPAAAAEMLETLGGAGDGNIADHAAVLCWAAAMPALIEKLEPQTWWNLLGGLQQWREGAIQRNAVESPLHLLIAAELGLTLAWRLSDLPSCRRLERSAAEALTAWCRRDQEAISAAVARPTQSRCVLASLLRCRDLLEKTTKRKFKKQQLAVADELAIWAAALTTHNGVVAFGEVSRKEIKDDLPPDGLLGRAMAFDPEALQPAIAAALGKTQSGGRLAWEVCLPEAFHHDSDAKIMVMFPEWDVRRGRTHLDYSGDQTRLEIFSGRTPLLAGTCQSMLAVDGEEQQPCSDWTTACEYTDDDVHYLEIEQSWTGGLLLQRQLLLIRDDRCMFIADAVLPQDRLAAAERAREICYDLRLPLAPSISVSPEPETRELFLGDGKRRGLVMPLSAGEWRVGPTQATLKETDDRHLLLTVRGSGGLYAPLWLDLQQRRFGRKRTWRQLTVADQLRIVDDNEAMGFRVQVGSEQWLIYRSFRQRCCRSVLGKHLLADFFCARFDTGDGSLEDLVTVDDNDEFDG
ncbi:MAG: hypothetical protein MI861_16555 [Pirellulales bacterium]|nr:hypothetical protein [Pirellulales bacterium]